MIHGTEHTKNWELRKKHITSIDEVLKWLDVAYSPGLPDPNIIDAEIYEVPVLEKADSFRVTEDTFPTESKIKLRRYRKLRAIGPNGGTLIMWEEQTF